MEPLRVLTTQELVDQLYAQHDAAVHAIFSKLLGVEMEPDDQPKRKPWGEDDE